MLKKLGIVKSKTKGYKAFTEHIESDFLNNNMAPMDYDVFLCTYTVVITFSNFYSCLTMTILSRY